MQDLRALRRWWWVPVAAIVIAVVVALALVAVSSSSAEARFRENVVIDALPPLFGPPIAPGPFDYARVATSDAVIADVAQRAGTTPELMKPRLTAEARINTPEIDFKVTGANALAVGRAWRDSFERAAVEQTPSLEATLAQPYERQLAAAAAALQQRSDVALAAPNGAIEQQQLKAAQENYETASRLSQSYTITAGTMKAQPFAVVGPHVVSAGVRSTRGRLAAALAIGLVAGVIAALLLEWTSRRRTGATTSSDNVMRGARFHPASPPVSPDDAEVLSAADNSGFQPAYDGTLPAAVSADAPAPIERPSKRAGRGSR